MAVGLEAARARFRGKSDKEIVEILDERLAEAQRARQQDRLTVFEAGIHAYKLLGAHEEPTRSARFWAAEVLYSALRGLGVKQEELAGPSATFVKVEEGDVTTLAGLIWGAYAGTLQPYDHALHGLGEEHESGLRQTLDTLERLAEGLGAPLDTSQRADIERRAGRRRAMVAESQMCETCSTLVRAAADEKEVAKRQALRAELIDHMKEAHDA